MRATGPHDEGGRVDRPDERDSVAQNVAGQLRQRGADVRDDETQDQLADLLTAVQRFERARSRLAGDSFVNTPGTDEPEDPMFVLPRRSDDDSVDDYIRRILLATQALQERGETGGR